MTQESKDHKEKWHAVSVLPRGRPCPQAVALRDHRFLTREAPPLPLPGCPKAGKCKCVYRHYADRRSGPRRGFEARPGKDKLPLSQDSERRYGPGRRSTDGERIK